MDSSNETEPSGQIPVSKLLIQHIEPLLVVRLIRSELFKCVCSSKQVSIIHIESAWYTPCRLTRWTLRSGVITTPTSVCVQW